MAGAAGREGQATKWTALCCGLAAQNYTHRHRHRHRQRWQLAPSTNKRMPADVSTRGLCCTHLLSASCDGFALAATLWVLLPLLLMRLMLVMAAGVGLSTGYAGEGSVWVGSVSVEALDATCALLPRLWALPAALLAPRLLVLWPSLPLALGRGSWEGRSVPVAAKAGGCTRGWETAAGGCKGSL